MSKNVLALHVGKLEKSILYPGVDTNQSQNLIDWSLTKDLLLLKIWFKSTDNILDILHTDRHALSHIET